MKASHIVLGAFLILFFLIVMVSTTGASSTEKMELSILMVRQAMGIFIATIAALMILLRALNQAAIKELLTLIVALFGGLILLNAAWPLVISLGLVVIGFVVIEVLGVVRSTTSSADAAPIQSTDEE